VEIQHGWIGSGADRGSLSRTADPGRAGEGPSAEAALLEAGRAGDRVALEQLLALHQRSVYALCYGILGHVEDAEDAVQETFLRALDALPRFRGEAAFRTWLYRIALKLCLRWKSARRPVDAGEPEAVPTAPETASPETLALRHLRLREALGALLPRQRAILLLKEREGWTVPEIAAGLGWSANRVEYDLYKARRALVEWRRRDAGEGEPE
jgi:RNA polymerase sigma-70 factor (ECF subfamily)